MKEHKWLVTFMEIVPDDLRAFSFIVKGRLKNTDGRRKEHWFAFSVERDSVTLEQMAEAFIEGGRTVRITAIPKVRKKKCVAPTVDERQLNLLDTINPGGGPAPADGLSTETQAGSGTSSPF